MKVTDIINYLPVNDVDINLVNDIKQSIITYGWVGAPILVSNAHCRLITGSHRLAALQDIYQNNIDIDIDALGDIAEDVDDIIDMYCDNYNCTIDDIPYDSLSDVFAGTRIDAYKDNITEW